MLISLSVALLDCYASEIESVIPAYSMGYVAIKNVSGIWDAIKASPSWGILVSSSDMQDIIGQLEKLLGVDLQELMGTFGQRVALVQVHSIPDPDDLPLSAVIIDVGDSAGASEVIQKIEQKLADNEDIEVRPGASMYRSVPFGLVGPKGEDLPIRYAFLNNLLVFAVGKDSFESIVDVYLGEEPSLIYDPKYNRTCADISSENEIFAYINMEVLWPFSRAMFGSDESQLFQILGVNEIKSIAYTASLLSPNREQEMYMFTGNDPGGIVASLFTPDQLLYSPHIIAASEADMFLAMHLGPPVVVWEKFINGVRSVLGEREYDIMQKSVYEFEQETGLSLNNDILPSLTGELGFAMPSPAVIEIAKGPEYLLKDGFMMFCGVADREKCAMSIEKMFSSASIETQQTEYKGVEIHEILPLSSPEIPVGYMFAGDLLIFGNFQQFEAIINEEPPLVTSEAFAGINSQLPQQSGLLYYINLESSAEILREMGLIQSEEDMARLKMLGSIGAGISNDGEGIKARWIGTSGSSWLDTIGEIAALLISAIH